MTSHHGRPLEAQLATARMLLAQYAAQIDEHDGMNREQRRTPRGRDLSSRIVGLRAGLKKWMTRAAELEAALSPKVGPFRVQLSRRKGYRKPENTVVVARPSRWGNPYTLEAHGRDAAVGMFRLYAIQVLGIEQIRADLAGKNLACWCPLEEPCHADVLLEIANGVEP